MRYINKNYFFTIFHRFYLFIMVKNQSTRLFTIILSTFLLLACKPAEKVRDIHLQPQCLPSQSQCVIATERGQFAVLFNLSPLVTETEFKIYLQQLSEQGKVPAKLLSVSAHLEGKNMYMGKIPLFFEESVEHIVKTPHEKNTRKVNALFITDALLGSCSEKVMTWVLWLDLELLVEGKIEKQKVFVEFDSQRYGD